LGEVLDDGPVVDVGGGEEEFEELRELGGLVGGMGKGDGRTAWA
jgi:hypothetical protein